jgi:hypothetical protein
LFIVSDKSTQNGHGVYRREDEEGDYQTVTEWWGRTLLDTLKERTGRQKDRQVSEKGRNGSHGQFCPYFDWALFGLEQPLFVP